MVIYHWKTNAIIKDAYIFIIEGHFVCSLMYSYKQTDTWMH